MATDPSVKEIISNQSNDSLGKRIRDLRTMRMQADQKSFARLLGVSQAIVSQWENGRYIPSAMALLAIGKLAGDDAPWWYEQAGEDYALDESVAASYKQTYRVDEEENRTILVYGEVGTGPFRCVPHEAIEKVSVPRAWFSVSAQVIGLLTKGDSMSPLIETGYIALVDRSQTVGSEQVDRIVAVGDGDGVTLKWLRKIGNSYLLVPNNENAENQIIPFTRNHHIFGRVVRWIGEPIAPSKRK